MALLGVVALARTLDFAGLTQDAYLGFTQDQPVACWDGLTCP